MLFFRSNRASKTVERTPLFMHLSDCTTFAFSCHTSALLFPSVSELLCALVRRDCVGSRRTEKRATRLQVSMVAERGCPSVPSCGMWRRFKYFDDEKWIWILVISQNSTETELQDVINVVEPDEKSAENPDPANVRMILAVVVCGCEREQW